MTDEATPFGGGRIEMMGEALLGLPSGGLWWEREATLIVADLHFEKASSFARRGSLLPPYDTSATLDRLESDVAALSPARVISLGDAFHDPFAVERLAEAAWARIERLQAARDWIWIDGNHDAAAATAPGGTRAETLAVGPLVFRHEPTKGAIGEIAGHLHPAARVKVASGTVRRRCFAGDGDRLILPAYGSLAGGLDVASRAFDGLFARRRLQVHLLGAGRVHTMPAEAVVGFGLSRDGTTRRRANR
ncbi:MAG: ligase-associated DNA damage response endonuclease PdeM [Hyphomicrobiales bacterium]|nr:ligase-associated DNA damage response endonuclease PdeM [Hyphomicrobiales bacterium]